jgi:hypothetical protein
MSDWKTTVSGILAITPQAVSAMNGMNPVWANLISAIAVAIGFFLAKDKEKK